MKKNLKLLSVILAMVLILSSCGGGSKKGKDPEKKQVVMISPLPTGDPFITLAYKGLENLQEEFGVKAKLVEALDKSEYSEQIRAMSESGANPIYVMWDDLAEEVFKIAPEFPDVDYIVVDTYATSELKNVKTIAVEPQDSAFIAGVIAANLSKTNKVSFVGSMDMPVINRYRAGFEAGVKYAGKDTQIESLYIGGADDPNKASELTKQVIANKADVVMHAANKAGLGVIQACEEMKIKAIGADDWQGSISNSVVWSALKDITGATYEAGKSSLEDKFEPGLTKYGAASGVKLFDDRDYQKLSDNLKKIVDETVEKLKSGEIKVPSEL